MTKKIAALIAATIVLSVASVSLGAPISYEGVLQDDVWSYGQLSDAGIVDSPSSNVNDYWSFWGSQGDVVTVYAARQDDNLDLAMWLFEGTFTDDAVFGPILDSFDPGFVAFADDEIPYPFGPFGDPMARIELTLPGTGQYTAIVTSWTTGPGNILDYSIQARGIASAPVPEPGTMFLLGTGLAGLAAANRRRKK